MQQVMIELTVTFDNPDITPMTWLTEFDDSNGLGQFRDLKVVAERTLGPLLADQCFYRIFEREAEG